MTKRPTPPFLLALGRRDPPAEIEVAGEVLSLERVFKHDFFAFTGLYRGAGRRIVLKMGRRATLLGLPISWIGRLLAWHEAAIYRRVEDIDIVPRFTGRWGAYAITHEYVPGHPLENGEQVRDDFFDRLEAGLAEIHRRGIAYVDLEKAENVLVTDDGAPCLFDFQIAFRWPRWLVRRLQESDRYHVGKLRRRCRPDTMTEEEYFASKRRPRHVQLYTDLTHPITRLRRRVLNRIDPSKRRGEKPGVVLPPQYTEPRRGPDTDTRSR